MELYFSTLLSVCSKHAVRLASTSINVYIAIYQICALPGGYLADRVLGEYKHALLSFFGPRHGSFAGNFKTQVVSNIINSVGIGLVLFSSWQYTQNPPSCCSSSHNTTCGGNRTCDALHVDNVVDGVNFGLPPTLNLSLAILGLMVIHNFLRSMSIYWLVSM